MDYFSQAPLGVDSIEVRPVKGKLNNAAIYKEKLKEKLGVAFRNYVILGACNPALAYQTLQEEINIGLLLPCNVIVYEQDRRSVVSAMDAARMLSVVGNPRLERLDR